MNTVRLRGELKIMMKPRRKKRILAQICS